MTENLTKSLIDLRRSGLAPQGYSELRLDHVESRFDIGSLVIALHESLRVEAVEMKHLPPDSGAGSTWLLAIKCHTVRLEGNVGLSVVVYYGLQVLDRQISLICADYPTFGALGAAHPWPGTSGSETGDLGQDGHLGQSPVFRSFGLSNFVLGILEATES